MYLYATLCPISSPQNLQNLQSLPHIHCATKNCLRLRMYSLNLDLSVRKIGICSSVKLEEMTMLGIGWLIWTWLGCVAGWGELLDMTSLWKNKATYTVWWNGMDRVCRYLPLSIHITSITMWLHVNPSALKEASTSHRDECQRFTWLRRNYTR